MRSATPDYFKVLGAPFRRRRAVRRWPRRAATSRQVVVNAAFARRYFGTSDVLHV